MDSEQVFFCQSVTCNLLVTAPLPAALFGKLTLTLLFLARLTHILFDSSKKSVNLLGCAPWLLT